MRNQIVAGNWKMNMVKDQAIDLITKIITEINERQESPAENASLILFPPFPWLSLAAELTHDHTLISVGAQNSYHKTSGAYTGEVSNAMIQSTGASYVILGHSERRAYFHETHQWLKEKVDAVIDAKLSPIFCCGETLEIREKNQQQDLIDQQLQESLFHLNEKDFQKVIIAYEPVWAIGTGKTASPQQAQEIHHFIRERIAKKYHPELANQTSILYGGSCKPDNAKSLFSQPDVDGGLIGGASLKAKDFIDIFFSF